jgi:glycosyltransferase involved in cell wall biosynthesis
MPRRPQILFLSPIRPAATGNGLAIRCGLFLEALAGIGDVDVVVLPVAGASAIPDSLLDRLARRTMTISVAGRVETHFSLVRRIRDPAERLQAFRVYGKPSLSASLSTPVLAELRAFVAGTAWDLVHVSRACLLPVLSVFDGQPVSHVLVDLDEDDIGARRRFAALRRRRGETVEAAFEEAEADAFHALLDRWLPSAEEAFTASEAEARLVAARHGRRPFVAENALPLPDRVERRGGGGLLFVGTLRYFPNADGAFWLLEEVLPLLSGMLGAVPPLALVGTTPPASLAQAAAARGVTLVGDAAELAPFYSAADAAIVPLRAGAGTSLKIIEAVFNRVPLVSTSIGTEGLDLDPRRDVLIADGPREFAEACRVALTDREAGRERAKRAFDKLAPRHVRARVVERIAARASAILGIRPGKGSLGEPI